MMRADVTYTQASADQMSVQAIDTPEWGETFYDYYLVSFRLTNHSQRPVDLDEYTFEAVPQKGDEWAARFDSDWDSEAAYTLRPQVPQGCTAPVSMVLRVDPERKALYQERAQQSVDESGYPTMAAHPGGAPGNFLAALNKYGACTAFLGKVGEDAFGRLLLNTLGEAGIETRGILADPAVFTTLAFVTFKEGDRSFSFARKPGADTMLRFDEVDLSLIDQTRVFHFGSLSLTGDPVRETTRRAVAYAREQGKLITFDPNLRPPLWDSADRAREEILWGLDQADVVKISDEEVAFLWDCGEAEGARRLLEDHGVSLAMVTLGPRGCLLVNRRGRAEAASPKVDVVDTTGAGDIFGGSAVSRLLKLGKAPEDLEEADLAGIARFAATAASLSTQKPGGIPSIPDEAEVLARMGEI